MIAFQNNKEPCFETKIKILTCLTTAANQQHFFIRFHQWQTFFRRHFYFWTIFGPPCMTFSKYLSSMTIFSGGKIPGFDYFSSIAISIPLVAQECFLRGSLTLRNIPLLDVKEKFYFTWLNKGTFHNFLYCNRKIQQVMYSYKIDTLKLLFWWKNANK